MDRSAHDVFQMSEKQFDQVYRQVLEPQLAELEEQRKRVSLLRKFSILAFCWMLVLFVRVFWTDGFHLAIALLSVGNSITVFIVLVFLAVMEGTKNLGTKKMDDGITILSRISLAAFFLTPIFLWFGHTELALIIAGFGFLGIIEVCWMSPLMAYRTDYKNIVIPQLLKHAGTDLTYTVKPEFSKQMLEESGLLNRRVTSLRAEDGITGYLGETALTVAEIEANQDKETLFQGIFCSANFAESFKGWIWIYPKRNIVGDGTLIGNTLAFFGSQKFESADRVHFDDQEFESLFRVYGSSPEEVQTILTPKLMRNLVVLCRESKENSENYPEKIAFSLSGNRVCVAMWSYKNHLEPNLDRPATDRKMLESKLRELETMLSIVEELNVQNY